LKAPDALFATVGCAGLAAAFAAAPAAARSAAGQDWSPFVLVSGLLLIGMVADGDGLFAAAGREVARLARDPAALFVGAVVLVGLVTATLNLDTSVAFLTPVLVYTARSRSLGEAPLLYGVLMLSNAGSLLLPGSNLTNLIVLGHLHLSGAHFLARMWLPWLAALGVTAAVIAVAERRSLRAEPGELAPPLRPVLGLGLAAVAVATVLVVVLRASAIPVAAVGAAVAAVRLGQRRRSLADVANVLGVPVLVGLFGVAVSLGTLGRSWAGPAELLGHLGSWATAALAAVTSVLVNNLPAASLLAARTPEHPFALLVGLNLGPNLFVTGSLAWILWLRAARAAGSSPSLARASRLGAVAVPLSMAAALGCLLLTGARLPGRRGQTRLGRLRISAAPLTTQRSGSSTTTEGKPATASILAASPGNSAPPPARRIFPRTMSSARSGGMSDSISSTESAIVVMDCFSASAITGAGTYTTRGVRRAASTPTTSMKPLASSLSPSVIFGRRAALRPMSRLNSARTACMIASSMAFPARRSDWQRTTWPPARTAASVVPPPMSTTKAPAPSARS
jgi:arsenical pump membrane protein